MILPFLEILRGKILQIAPSSLTGNLRFLESSFPVNANRAPGAISVLLQVGVSCLGKTARTVRFATLQGSVCLQVFTGMCVRIACQETDSESEFCFNENGPVAVTFKVGGNKSPQLFGRSGSVRAWHDPVIQRPGQVESSIQIARDPPGSTPPGGVSGRGDHGLDPHV